MLRRRRWGIGEWSALSEPNRCDLLLSPTCHILRGLSKELGCESRFRRRLNLLDAIFDAFTPRGVGLESVGWRTEGTEAMLGFSARYRGSLIFFRCSFLLPHSNISRENGSDEGCRSALIDLLSESRYGRQIPPPAGSGLHCGNLSCEPCPDDLKWTRWLVYQLLGAKGLALRSGEKY